MVANCHLENVKKHDISGSTIKSTLHKLDLRIFSGHDVHWSCYKLWFFKCNHCRDFVWHLSRSWRNVTSPDSLFNFKGA